MDDDIIYDEKGTPVGVVEGSAVVLLHAKPKIEKPDEAGKVG